MTRSDYFRPVSGGISGLCVEPDDKSIWEALLPGRRRLSCSPRFCHPRLQKLEAWHRTLKHNILHTLEGLLHPLIHVVAFE